MGVNLLQNRRRMIMVAQPHPVTESGQSIAITNGFPAPLKACTVTFAPVQSGTGDPSPSNIRAISGRTGLSVYVSQTSSGGTEYPVSWTDYGTVYGGTLDLTNGELITEWGYIRYTGAQSESWNVENQSNFYIMTPNIYSRVTKDESTLICNMAKSANSVNDGECRITSSGNFNIRIGSLIGINNVNDFKAWLSNHNLEVAVALQTPIRTAINPIAVMEIRGENHIWSDAGNVSVTYYTI